MKQVIALLLMTIVLPGTVMAVNGNDLMTRARAYYEKQDYLNAYRQFQRAARAGQPAAEMSLGFMYEKGQGVSVNHHEAMRHYKRAASLGMLGAYTRLGMAYYEGDITRQRYDLAMAMNLVILRNGEDKIAQAMTRIIENKMKPKDLERAKSIAIKILKNPRQTHRILSREEQRFEEQESGT